MTIALDPSPILDVGFGFWPSKVLLSAVELGVFSELARVAAHARRARRRAGDPPARLDGSVRRAGRAGLPRARRATASARSTGTRALTDALPRPRQARVHRRDARDARGAPVPLLGRPHRGAAHGQAAERDQAHGRADVRDAVQRPAAARAVHGRDAGHLAAQLRGARGEVRLLALPDAVRRRRRDRAALVARSPKRHPHLRCTSCDLPVVEPIARRTIAAAGLARAREAPRRATSSRTRCPRPT